MAELEALHLRLAVAVQVITAVEAATAPEVMEAMVRDLASRLPLAGLPLGAEAVPLFLVVLPEIARHLVDLASASSNTTFMR